MLNLNNLIDKKEIIVENHLLESTHIALCFDKHYGLPAGVLITSIIHNNADKNFSFHLFVMSINEDDIEKLKKLNTAKVSISLYYVNDRLNINPETLVLSYISIATCIRLFVPDYLSNVTKTLLYLDCDMLCEGNIDEIIKHNIIDHIAAVVIDVDETQKKRISACKLKAGPYFNAGMLYINTDLWKKFGITEQALDKINDGNVYEYADQDILNILLEGRIKFISAVCNDMSFKRDISADKSNRIADTNSVILHYIGPNKPWFFIYLDEKYEKYLKLSPWKNDALIMFDKKTATGLRKYSNYLRYNQDYFNSLKYFLLYLLKKYNIYFDK